MGKGTHGQRRFGIPDFFSGVKFRISFSNNNLINCLSRPPRAHPALADRRRGPQGQVQERRHDKEGQDEGQADGRRGNRKKMRGVAATIRKDVTAAVSV